MNDYQMGAVESRFADMIWENEPVSSTELSKRCEEQFKWKKSTTYTVLKRLCDKGIFKNDKGTVTSVVSRQEFYSLQSERFVEEAFDGSLPAFLAAFTSRQKISDAEIDEIQKMIDRYRKGAAK